MSFKRIYINALVDSPFKSKTRFQGLKPNYLVKGINQIKILYKGYHSQSSKLLETYKQNPTLIIQAKPKSTPYKITKANVTLQDLNESKLLNKSLETQATKREKGNILSKNQSQKLLSSKPDLKNVYMKFQDIINFYQDEKQQSIGLDPTLINKEYINGCKPRVTLGKIVHNATQGSRHNHFIKQDNSTANYKMLKRINSSTHKVNGDAQKKKSPSRLLGELTTHEINSGSDGKVKGNQPLKAVISNVSKDNKVKPKMKKHNKTVSQSFTVSKLLKSITNQKMI